MSLLVPPPEVWLLATEGVSLGLHLPGLPGQEWAALAAHVLVCTGPRGWAEVGETVAGAGKESWSNWG